MEISYDYSLPLCVSGQPRSTAVHFAVSRNGVQPPAAIRPFSAAELSNPSHMASWLGAIAEEDFSGLSQESRPRWRRNTSVFWGLCNGATAVVRVFRILPKMLLPPANDAEGKQADLQAQMHAAMMRLYDECCVNFGVTRSKQADHSRTTGSVKCFGIVARLHDLRKAAPAEKLPVPPPFVAEVLVAYPPLCSAWCWFMEVPAAPPLREFLLQYVLRDVLEQLGELHQDGRCHGAVKSTNIFILSDVPRGDDAAASHDEAPLVMPRAVLLDGGLHSLGAGWLQADAFCDSYPVLLPAPELRDATKSTSFTPSSDIWDVGVVAMDLALSRPRSILYRPHHAVLRVTPPLLRSSEGWSATLSAFLAACLGDSPEVRSPLGDLLRHLFFEPLKQDASQRSSLLGELQKQHGSAASTGSKANWRSVHTDPYRGWSASDGQKEPLDNSNNVEDDTPELRCNAALQVLLPAIHEMIREQRESGNEKGATELEGLGSEVLLADGPAPDLCNAWIENLCERMLDSDVPDLINAVGPLFVRRSAKKGSVLSAVPLAMASTTTSACPSPGTADSSPPLSTDASGAFSNAPGGAIPHVHSALAGDAVSLYGSFTEAQSLNSYVFAKWQYQCHRALEGA